MALRKEPERRYESVALLAGDVERHLDVGVDQADIQDAALKVGRKDRLQVASNRAIAEYAGRGLVLDQAYIGTLAFDLGFVLLKMLRQAIGRAIRRYFQRLAPAFAVALSDPQRGALATQCQLRSVVIGGHQMVRARASLR